MEDLVLIHLFFLNSSRAKLFFFLPEKLLFKEAELLDEFYLKNKRYFSHRNKTDNQYCFEKIINVVFIQYEFSKH